MRMFHVALLVVSKSQVHANAHIVRRLGQNAEVFLNGCIELPSSGESGAEVGARFHHSRLNRQGLSIVVDCGFQIAVLLC